jgi:hypothetical protein
MSYPKSREIPSTEDLRTFSGVELPAHGACHIPVQISIWMESYILGGHAQIIPGRRILIYFGVLTNSRWDLLLRGDRANVLPAPRRRPL